jgi:hypothetical protein
VSDASPIQNDLKQGETLRILLLSFIIDYGIRKVKKMRNVWGCMVHIHYRCSVNMLSRTEIPYREKYGSSVRDYKGC